ncbi:Tripartite tricarboxylate transporter family receptor [compost metagenome]
MVALFAPVKTPAAIVSQLNAEVVRVLNEPEVKQRLFESGAEAAPGTQAELLADMKAEMAVTGKLLKSIGIKAR